MPNEIPQYRIHTMAPGAYVEGLGILATNEVYSLSDAIEPRNSWEPLNDAAREAFKRRNERTMAASTAKMREVTDAIDEAKDAGATDAELAGLIDQLAKLRVDHAALPRKLRAVPTLGAKPTHSLSEYMPVDRKPPQAHIDEAPFKERLERTINAARAGGLSEADIGELKRALERRDLARAKQVTEDAAKKPKELEKKPEPKADAEKKAARASDS